MFLACLMFSSQVLTNLATDTNIAVILREFQTYIGSSDKEFVAAAIQAIGRWGDEREKRCCIWSIMKGFYLFTYFSDFLFIYYFFIHFIVCINSFLLPPLTWPLLSLGVPPTSEKWLTPAWVALLVSCPTVMVSLLLVKVLCAWLPFQILLFLCAVFVVGNCPSFANLVLLFK